MLSSSGALCLLFFSFIGLGTAQTSSASAGAVNTFISQFPQCALQCLLGSIEASPCSMTDIACQCTNSELVASTEACVMTSCTVVESLAAKNLTQTQCAAPIRDKAFQYNVVSCTLFAIALAFVLIRTVYTKFFTSKDLGLDDCFIILTLRNCVPSAVINVNMLAANGLGKDTWTLTPDQITGFAKGFYIITIMYFSEVFVLKLSMLFFYLRIFPGPNIRRLLWATVAFDVLFGVSFIFTAIFQCRPISYNWTNWRREGGGTCADVSYIAWANAIVSILLDLWMLALPLSQLRELNLHWKKKVGVALMFCVGTFVTVVSAVRLGSLVQFRNSSNITWDYWGVCLWSTVEITVGIICACMPALRLILIRVAPKVFDGSVARRVSMYYPNKMRSADKSSGNATESEASAIRKSVRFSLKQGFRHSAYVGRGQEEKTPSDGGPLAKGSPRDHGSVHGDLGMTTLDQTTGTFGTGGFGTSVTVSSIGSVRNKRESRRYSRHTPSPH
ncbi:hypothetical protein F4778DRAFT_8858 [Xylariomycetidae sp. FL2044]|nr:hypothetical protein F4778DRAFT_8858 [Xylariomycetidae sp. FL2044]